MPSELIAFPATYAEWAVLLEILKKKSDDEAVLYAARNGTLEWQSGVAERFSKRLIETINYRMNSASDKFQREIARSGGHERAVIQAILALRKEMKFLADAVDLPVIPENSRTQYRQLVIEQANHMQKSVEESSKADRSGKLTAIVQNNKINDF